MCISRSEGDGYTSLELSFHSQSPNRRHGGTLQRTSRAGNGRIPAGVHGELSEMPINGVFLPDIGVWLNDVSKQGGYPNDPRTDPGNPERAATGPATQPADGNGTH